MVTVREVRVQAAYKVAHAQFDSMAGDYYWSPDEVHAMATFMAEATVDALFPADKHIDDLRVVP